MQSLKDKKILFFDGSGNAYHKGIITAFETLGAKVTPLVYGNFMNDTKMNRLKKMFRLKKICFKDNDFLDAISGDFDILFIKNPERGNKRIFIELRKRYPNIPFINYNWNSINHVDYREYIPLFDKVFSFDPVDAKKYNLEYYPLFYLPEFEKIGIDQKKDYGISFVGSGFTPGRAEFMTKFFDIVSAKKISVFLHLYAYSWKEFVTGKFIKNYNFKKSVSLSFLPHEKLLEIYKKSLAFVDHPMSIQNGHTIRTFETLASGLLLISTNKGLKNEPFYDPARIHIIEEDASDLNIDFVTAYKPSFPSNFEKYRIDNWLQYILKDTVRKQELF